ncbi:hypothetical protein GDO86_003548 [Hymenochirus boettgeri]|uniref:Eukaryotic translation initiation factor 2D n=1 Tax=Hymenochirus boettgeri TaxID=247094 RepID=A0A8T2K9X2_9PIPI|nr:hypothetical protein GDO86_003548 [Hymenochirus boettgeri]
MFAKAFKIKSNTAIKGSDRRKLRANISSTFPSLTEENLSKLMPSKEELNIVKVYVHKGDAVTIYVHIRNPIMFELERNLYPTVYTLWKYPDLLPGFITWTPVLEKMTGGADLMLPGVVVPPCGVPDIQQGSLCAVTLVGNRAPVAIGLATRSTKEMLASGMKGKGFNILHTFGDQLWAFGDKSCPPIIPVLENNLAFVELEAQKESKETVSEAEAPQMELEGLHLSVEDSGVPHVTEENQGHSDLEQHIETGDTTPCQKSPQEDMDNLLHQCFFHALKYKLSKFLDTMQNRKVLQVKELNKGVESIVEINWKHPDVRAFIASNSVLVDQEASKEMDESVEPLYHPPEIITLYGISSKILPLFKEAGHGKGDLLSQSDVRSIIITYVKNNELVDSNNKNLVNINPILCDCLLEKSEHNEVSFLKWDDLLSRCLERMQHFHQVTFPGHPPISRKGNIEPIDISVAQRASNKKVTMIKNLELYGLDPSSIGNMLQQRVQASATCTVIPGSKDRIQVQIQGNQVSQIGRLLLEDFKIPRKYITGLELGKPSKKK